MKKPKYAYSPDPILNEMAKQCFAGTRSPQKTAEKAVVVNLIEAITHRLRAKADVRLTDEQIKFHKEVK